MSDLTLEEKQNQIKCAKIKSNATVVANIIDLVAGVVINVADKDVADNLGSQTLNRSVLGGMIGNVIKEEIINKGAVK